MGRRRRDRDEQVEAGRQRCTQRVGQRTERPAAVPKFELLDEVGAVIDLGEDAVDMVQLGREVEHGRRRKLRSTGRAQTPCRPVTR